MTSKKEQELNFKCSEAVRLIRIEKMLNEIYEMLAGAKRPVVDDSKYRQAIKEFVKGNNKEGRRLLGEYKQEGGKIPPLRES